MRKKNGLMMFILGFSLLFFTPSVWSNWSMSPKFRFDSGNQQFFLQVELKDCEWDKVQRGNVTRYVQMKGVESYAANHSYGRFVQVRGKFDQEQSYELTVDGRICNISGKSEMEIKTPPFPPALEFLSSGLYFSKLNPRLRFRYRQLEKVDWTIYRINAENRFLFSQTENLRVSSLQSNGENQLTSSDIDYLRYLKSYPSKRFRLNSRFKKSRDWAHASIDLGPYAKAGEWLAIVRNNEQIKIVQFTDIGLFVRQNPSKIWGQTVRLATAIPAPSKILLKQLNGEISGAIETDEEGRFEYFWDKTKQNALNKSLHRIEARVGEDSVEIFLQDGSIPLSSFPVGGVDQSKTPLQAFVYSNRGLYRLGDTVHLAILLRDWQQNLPEDNVSADLTLYGPNGKITHTTLKGFEQQNGGMDWSWQVPHDAQTGRYRAEILHQGKMLGTGKFSVEQIIPPSIEGELVFDDSVQFWEGKWPLNEPITGTVNSRFLFGAPASGKQWRFQCLLEPGKLEAPGMEDFVFEDGLKVFPAVTFAQKESLHLDKNGKGTWQCLDDNKLAQEEVMKKLPGVGKLRVLGTVFEEGGRSIDIDRSIPAFFHPVYPGIKALFEGNLETGKAAPFQIVALDPRTGKTVPGVKLTVELWEKDYWGWYYFHNSDEEVVDSQLTRILTTSKTVISQSQPLLFNVTPPACCDWELRVTVSGSEVSSRVAFSNGWWREDSGLSTSLSQKITFTADQKKYKVGDIAHILITTPFDGELLISQENDRAAFLQEKLKVLDRKAEYAVKITEKHVPWFRLNGVLLRTLAKPDLSGRGFPAKRETPYRALGMLAVQADDPREFLDFALSHPQEVRPESSFPLSIQALDEQGLPLKEETWLTVSVTDEGILNLIDFKSPNPYTGLHRQPAYLNQWFDTMGLVVPYSLHRGESAFGAGENLLDLLKQVKRIQAMAWWSGVVKTDAEGKLMLQVPVNDYTGRVRVMVAGWQSRRSGYAESRIPVLAPVDLLTSLPRVLGAEDRSRAVAEVFNNSDRAQQMEIRLELEGPLRLADKNSVRTPVVPARQSLGLHWELAAMGSPGLGVVKFFAKNEDGEFRRRTTRLAVRPVSTPQHFTETFLLKPGDSSDFFIPEQAEFLPGSGQWEVMLSASPMIKLGEHLKQLVSYPYGCAEQTASRLMAMLLLRPTLGDAALEEYLGDRQTGKIDQYIKDGIKKLESMQMADGGFAYWEGGDDQYPWINAYVTHFLREAQKHSHAVPKKMVQKALKKLKMQTRFPGKIRPDAAAYSTFVLALNGQVTKSDLQSLLIGLRKRNNSKRFISMGVARALTEGAVIRAGYTLPSSALNGLPTYDLRTPRQLWWRNHHFLSAEGGFALKLFSQAIAGKAEAVPLGLVFLDQLKSRRYLSTHTLAWTLMAMNALFPEASQESRVTVKTPWGRIHPLSTMAGQNQAYGNLEQDGGIPFNLLNSSSDRNVFGSIIFRGFPAETGKSSHENQIELQRHYFTEEGQLLQVPFSVTQGSRLFVVITARHRISALKGLSNVLIEDWLPAGFEVDNPRLSGQGDLPTLPPQVLGLKRMEINHFDTGDDKVAVFGKLSRNFETAVYSVRAVSQGVFRLMPYQAEAMYIPEINAFRAEGNSITVTPPKAQ
ncbi:MAG: hypothetical protein HQM13_04265 [SAR324 cluster bacterium]|nr:hypothetical protein [SAR324 cluster bacterium]